MKNICGNIEAVFLKLGTTNVHHKRNKMTPLVLLTIKISEKTEQRRFGVILAPFSS